MEEMLLRILDKVNRAILVCDQSNNGVVYGNKQAKMDFGDGQGMIHPMDIFPSTQSTPYLVGKIREQLKEGDSTVLFDLECVDAKGKSRLCDLQVGYANGDRTLYFLEISYKEDDRMARALSHMATSNRAEGIVHLNDRLTLHHWNDKFGAVLPTGTVEFSDIFPEEERETLLADIHRGLQSSPHYYTRIRLTPPGGKVTWFGLDLERRTLDEEGEKVLCFLENIHQRVKLEGQLDEANQYLETIQNLSNDVIFHIDIPSRTLTRRAEKAKRFGLTDVVEDFPYSVIKSGILHPDDCEIYEKKALIALSGLPGMVEVRMKTPKGDYRYRRMIWAPLVQENQPVTQVFGRLSDVQMVRELEEKANYDSLTGALNKVSMGEAVERSLALSSQEVNHAVLFLDLDDFKYVNDNLGHKFGDFLLKTLGQRLRDCVRAGDLIGRVGGDEFVLFLRGVSNPDMLLSKAQMILSSLNQPVLLEDKSHIIRASIGIAMYPEHGTTFEELYHRADLALYHSKHQGKNTAFLYQDSFEEEKGK